MEEDVHLPTTPIPFSRDKEAVLFIHFINTNEGDCIFLEVPEKLKSQSGVIIPKNNSKSNYTNLLVDMGIGGKIALDSFLNKISISSIHYGFISHPDIDHCKDFPKLLEKNPQLHVWVPKCYPQNVNDVYKELFNRKDFKNLRHFANTGELLSGKRSKIEIIAPTEQYLKKFIDDGKKDRVDEFDVVGGVLDKHK